MIVVMVVTRLVWSVAMKRALDGTPRGAVVADTASTLATATAAPLCQLADVDELYDDSIEQYVEECRAAFVDSIEVHCPLIAAALLHPPPPPLSQSLVLRPRSARARHSDSLHCVPIERMGDYVHYRRPYTLREVMPDELTAGMPFGSPYRKRLRRSLTVNVRASNDSASGGGSGGGNVMDDVREHDVIVDTRRPAQWKPVRPSFDDWIKHRNNHQHTPTRIDGNASMSVDGGSVDG